MATCKACIHYGICKDGDADQGEFFNHHIENMCVSFEKKHRETKRFVNVEPYKDFFISANREDEGIKVIDLPIADVEERNCGEWISKGHFTITCSECGKMFADYDCEISAENYCPSCGSRMSKRKQN